jgi:plastocyanin
MHARHVIAAVIAIALVAGCRRSPSADTPAPPDAGIAHRLTPIAAADAGTASISGEAQLTGAAPAPGKLHREADPFCAHKEMNDPTVLAENGKLANVWVHVTKGAPDSPAPPQTLEVTQQDCMYEPRVTVAVVGQKIAARNGDPVLHNVHTYVGASTLFNRGMPNDKAAPIEFAATEEGVIKWKCDVHPWMRGYTGVSKNAYQAVTGKDGAFQLVLPPGPYTIEAWHEKYGTKTVEVTAPGHVVITFEAE